MTRVIRRALLGAAIAGIIACRSEPVSVEEVYTTRTLGLSHLRRNQLVEAESAFRKLTRIMPDDPLGYANLGLTYLQGGRYDDAEKQLRRARKLDPASTEVGLALAKLYSLTQRPSDARAILEQLRSDSVRNARVLYALAELEAQEPEGASAGKYEGRLREVLAVAPGNLAVRLKLVASLARRGEADSAVRHLEDVRRIPPEPPKDARVYLDSAILLFREGLVAQARPTLDHFLRLMEVTAPYQASLEAVKWTESAIPGYPVLTFAPRDYVSTRARLVRTTDDVVKFTDGTSDAGFPGAGTPGGSVVAPGPPGVPAALAFGNVDGVGRDDLFVSVWSPAQRRSVAHLYRVQGGYVRDATEGSGIALPQGASFATFADFDNDGWLDLFVIGGGEGARGHLFRNRGDVTFEDVTSRARVGDVKGARKALFVDLDHDGDLDLLLVGPGPRTVYRNNLDGTFTEATANYGLAGGNDSDVAFADFDGDGRTDVFITNAQGSDVLFRNGGAQRFADVTTTSGLATTGGSGAVAVGDYNNDGFLDLIVASAGAAEPAFWLNSGSATFTRDRRSSAVAQALRSAAGLVVSFVDYDNDGWLDLVAGTPVRGAANAPRFFVFRNDGTGRFLDRSSAVPSAARSLGGSAIAVSDVDDDGDEDLVVLDGAGEPRFLRNEGGNNNLAVNVELKALRNGSGKNNAFGIGARLELRAGEIYQTRIATGRTTHFGLGPHLKADVLRIEWPNGVPQTVFFPGSDQDVLELEMLKGSCGFVYTWDGKGFRFVTDAMWRSALGMPLGLMGGGSQSAFAPAGASQEYVRIAGDALQPRDGRYVLQFTEELWETAYADEVKLIAVDHPDSVDVFVDERFVPPGPVKLRLFQVARKHLPRSAVDERGRDVLPALRERDDVYVSNLTPTQYQGVVQSHDLIMDLGAAAGGPDTHLFLRGWIYPTDASINVALSQQSTINPVSPSLEVRDARGNWRTVHANIGFPSGKDKTIVVDLAGIFPTADRHVRIRTTMQIYWDHAFVGHDLANSSAQVTTLAPVSADLHYRGFSRMYRKGGRYGPYWFAYDDVSKDSPWRGIDGAFTRFGDVLPLLRNADDMYVVMGPGDETTIEFDASSATALPRGWKRDFLLYTDGWIKDSDLNTAFGTTVGPLPYHGVKAYPYGPSDAYPTDAVRQRYLREYNTRRVKGAGSSP